MRRLGLLSLLLVTLSAANARADGPPAAGAQAHVAVARELVRRYGQTEGLIWFELNGVNLRLIAPVDQLDDQKTLTDTLKASYDQGRAVVVHYDVESGHIDADASEPSFRIRDLSFDGRTIVELPPEPGPEIPVDAASRPAADAALVRGASLLASQDLTGAHDAFDTALSGEALRPSLYKFALSMRARAAFDLAGQTEPRPGPEADKLILASLSDYRELAKLEPGEPGPRTGIANAFEQLGAYDDAIAEFQQIMELWPSQAFWPTIGIVISQRDQGRPAAALATLDQYAASHGKQDGMAFHYHRGWTLSDLGRYADAADEFTTGLKHQPDYVWAFVRRACAYGQMGQLSEALADEIKADELFHDQAKDVTLTRTRAANLTWADGAVQALRAALAKDAHARTDLACRGYATEMYASRPRSALLPASAPP